jgi:hypothetical protein
MVFAPTTARATRYSNTASENVAITLAPRIDLAARAPRAGLHYGAQIRRVPNLAVLS